MPTISSIFKINIKFPKSQLAFPTLILKMPTVMLEIPTYILEVKNFNLLQHLKSFRPKINLNLLDSLSIHTPPPPRRLVLLLALTNRKHVYLGCDGSCLDNGITQCLTPPHLGQLTQQRAAVNLVHIHLVLGHCLSFTFPIYLDFP